MLPVAQLLPRSIHANFVRRLPPGAPPGRGRPRVRTARASADRSDRRIPTAVDAPHRMGGFAKSQAEPGSLWPWAVSYGRIWYRFSRRMTQGSVTRITSPYDLRRRSRPDAADKPVIRSVLAESDSSGRLMRKVGDTRTLAKSRGRWHDSVLLFFLILLLPGGRAAAQSVPPDLYGGLKWRLLGPFRGGRVVAVSGIPADSKTFYFGAVNGGVWKTTSAGVVWEPIFDDQSVASIGALSVAPSDPNIIYVGTGETDIRSDLSSGAGVYKSTDAGRTWTRIGLEETRQVSRIVVDPRNADVVYVGALGHAYAPNEERGVYKSTDGGAHWTKVLDQGKEIGVSDLAICAGNPDTLFAGTWHTWRPPWSTYATVDGPGSSLFRSQDDGKTWAQLKGKGLPEGDWG